MFSRIHCMIALITLTAATLAAQPTVTSVSPASHAGSAGVASDVTAGFSTAMGTPGSGDFLVRSNLRGLLNGSLSGGGSNTLTFDPSADLLPGEQVEVVLTTGLQDSTGAALASPYAWRYRGAAGTGPARFTAKAYQTGGASDWDAEFGDLDNDGDIDLVTVDYLGQNYVHINDGKGNFSKTAFGATDSASYAVCLGDMDGDGYLDIVVGNWGSSQQTSGPPTGQNRIWINNGSGGFTSSIDFGTNTTATIDLDLGDLDGDGDLDIVTANGAISPSANNIYINDGSANFTESVFALIAGYTYPVTNLSWAIRLGDADNDGDLDAFVGNFGFTGPAESYVYFNDGAGNFDAQHRNTITAASSVLTMALADLDGDGDLDVATGTNSNYAAYIYWNDGSGAYPTSTIMANGFAIWAVEAGDVDGDGDLDLAIGKESGQSYILLNANGTFGNIVNLGPAGTSMHAIAFADVDGDGDLDAGSPDRLCFNGSNAPTIQITSNGTAVNDGDTLNVSYGDTVASLGLNIAVDDADGDAAALSTQITNLTSQGFTMSEWQRSTQATAYAATPTSGTFNQGTTTHVVTLMADDGDDSSTIAFNITVGSAPNNPPSLFVVGGGGSVGNGGTLAVSYNTTLTSMSFAIQVSDPENDNVTLTCNISNIGTTGLNTAEFSANQMAAPYTLYPKSGTFNQAAVQHTITLDADDGQGGTTNFTFYIVVGAAPNNAPTVSVSNTGGSISNGATLNVAYGSSLASLGLTITVDDADGDSVSLTGSVSNSTGTGILNSEFSSSAQATSYNVTPSTGTFNSASTVHSITLSVDDGKGGTGGFSFSISVGAAPTPKIEVFETSAAGTQISPGAGASGGRDFGSQLVAAGATSALTVVISNAGTANLSVSSVTVGGAGAGEFVLNVSGISSNVAPGGSTQFTVAFDPTSAGSKTATVEIQHNDTSTSIPFTFDVAGVGTTPAPVPLIVVKAGGSTIANGASATGNLNFGGLQVGTASGALTIMVENAGNADLTVGTPSLNGSGALEYTLNTTGMLSVVPAGQSTSFTITYMAANAGTFAATVSFSHDDTSTNTPFTFDVVGSATTPTTPGGNAGGGSGGSGGGCVATSESSLIALALLIMLGGLAVARRRARA